MNSKILESSKAPKGVNFDLPNSEICRTQTGLGFVPELKRHRLVVVIEGGCFRNGKLKARVSQHPYRCSSWNHDETHRFWGQFGCWDVVKVFGGDGRLKKAEDFDGKPVGTVVRSRVKVARSKGSGRSSHSLLPPFPSFPLFSLVRLSSLFF